MDRRSQLMALAVVFVVAAALFPATSRAAGNCLASPTGAARDGKHWHYRIDRQTQQKCWSLGAPKSATRTAALRSFFNAMDQAQPVHEAMAATCAVAPNGHAPRGKHWYYQIDAATDQKCWHLSSRNIRPAKVASAHTPPSVLLAAAGQSAELLPPSIADAQASLQDNAPASAQTAGSAPDWSDETASSASVHAKPAIDGDPAVLNFASRWPDDLKMSVSGNPTPGRPRNSASNRLAAADGRTGLFRNVALMLSASPPLVDILVVFVATLGSVLILLGFVDWSFLFRTPASAAPKHRSPLKLPKLDAESDPISALRPDRSDMLSFFAPTTATAAGVGAAARFLVGTV